MLEKPVDDTEGQGYEFIVEIKVVQRWLDHLCIYTSNNPINDRAHIHHQCFNHDYEYDYGSSC